MKTAQKPHAFHEKRAVFERPLARNCNPMFCFVDECLWRNYLTIFDLCILFKFQDILHMLQFNLTEGEVHKLLLSFDLHGDGQ